MSKYKIRDVRAIITHPPGARTLTVVKVETTEPELYGVGCASFHPFGSDSSPLAALVGDTNSIPRGLPRGSSLSQPFG